MSEDINVTDPVIAIPPVEAGSDAPTIAEQAKVDAIVEEVKEKEEAEADPNRPHFFLQGDPGCELCGRRRKHLIHKIRRPKMYQEGDVVGEYVVGKHGEFRRAEN